MWTGSHSGQSLSLYISNYLLPTIFSQMGILPTKTSLVMTCHNSRLGLQLSACTYTSQSLSTGQSPHDLPHCESPVHA